MGLEDAGDSFGPAEHLPNALTHSSHPCIRCPPTFRAEELILPNIWPIYSTFSEPCSASGIRCLRIDRFCNLKQARLRVAFNLVLPEPHDFPALLAQQAAVLRIPSAVGFNLCFPLLGELVPPFGVLPTVPEVAVNEDRQLHETEYEVRTTGEISGMALPYEPPCREPAGNQEFWAGVLPPNPGHHPRARLWRHDITPMLSRTLLGRRDGLSSGSAA
jgi:hypothetical protein